MMMIRRRRSRRRSRKLDVQISALAVRWKGSNHSLPSSEVLFMRRAVQDVNEKSLSCICKVIKWDKRNVIYILSIPWFKQIDSPWYWISFYFFGICGASIGSCVKSLPFVWNGSEISRMEIRMKDVRYLSLSNTSAAVWLRIFRFHFTSV